MLINSSNLLKIGFSANQKKVIKSSKAPKEGINSSPSIPISFSEGTGLKPPKRLLEEVLQHYNDLPPEQLNPIFNFFEGVWSQITGEDEQRSYVFQSQIDIKDLTPEQIASLSKREIINLTTSDIDQLTRNQLEALVENHIETFASAQVGALFKKLIDSLTPVEKQIIQKTFARRENDTESSLYRCWKGWAGSPKFTINITDPQAKPEILLKLLRKLPPEDKLPKYGLSISQVIKLVLNEIPLAGDLSEVRQKTDSSPTPTSVIKRSNAKPAENTSEVRLKDLTLEQLANLTDDKTVRSLEASEVLELSNEQFEAFLGSRISLFTTPVFQATFARAINELSSEQRSIALNMLCPSGMKEQLEESVSNLSQNMSFRDSCKAAGIPERLIKLFMRLPGDRKLESQGYTDDFRFSSILQALQLEENKLNDGVNLQASRASLTNNLSPEEILVAFLSDQQAQLLANYIKSQPNPETALRKFSSIIENPATLPTLRKTYPAKFLEGIKSLSRKTNEPYRLLNEALQERVTKGQASTNSATPAQKAISVEAPKDTYPELTRYEAVIASIEEQIPHLSPRETVALYTLFRMQNDNDNQFKRLKDFINLFKAGLGQEDLAKLEENGIPISISEKIANLLIDDDDTFEQIKLRLNEKRKQDANSLPSFVMGSLPSLTSEQRRDLKERVDNDLNTFKTFINSLKDSKLRSDLAKSLPKELLDNLSLLNSKDEITLNRIIEELAKPEKASVEDPYPELGEYLDNLPSLVMRGLQSLTSEQRQNLKERVGDDLNTLKEFIGNLKNSLQADLANLEKSLPSELLDDLRLLDPKDEITLNQIIEELAKPVAEKSFLNLLQILENYPNLKENYTAKDLGLALRNFVNSSGRNNDLDKTNPRVFKYSSELVEAFIKKEEINKLSLENSYLTAPGIYDAYPALSGRYLNEEVLSALLNKFVKENLEIWDTHVDRSKRQFRYSPELVEDFIASLQGTEGSLTASGIYAASSFLREYYLSEETLRNSLKQFASKNPEIWDIHVDKSRQPFKYSPKLVEAFTANLQNKCSGLEDGLSFSEIFNTYGFLSDHYSSAGSMLETLRKFINRSDAWTNHVDRSKQPYKYSRELIEAFIARLKGLENSLSSPEIYDTYDFLSEYYSSPQNMQTALKKFIDKNSEAWIDHVDKRTQVYQYSDELIQAFVASLQSKGSGLKKDSLSSLEIYNTYDFLCKYYSSPAALKKALERFMDKNEAWTNHMDTSKKPFKYSKDLVEAFIASFENNGIEQERQAQLTEGKISSWTEFAEFMSVAENQALFQASPIEFRQFFHIFFKNNVPNLDLSEEQIDKLYRSASMQAQIKEYILNTSLNNKQRIDLIEAALKSSNDSPQIEKAARITNNKPVAEPVRNKLSAIGELKAWQSMNPADLPPTVAADCKNKLWNEFNQANSAEKEQLLIELGTLTGFGKQVADEFLAEVLAVETMKTELDLTALGFREDFSIKPNLMQLLTAYRAKNNKFVFNASEPGAGKTLAGMIVALNGSKGRILVLEPNSLVGQIISDYRAYLDPAKVKIIAFSPDKDPDQNQIRNDLPRNSENLRLQIEQAEREGKRVVIVADYGIFDDADNSRSIEKLSSLRFVRAIADEAHAGKSGVGQDGSNTARGVQATLNNLREINPDFQLTVFTGTPVVNDPQDLSNIVEVFSGKPVGTAKGMGAIIGSARAVVFPHHWIRFENDKSNLPKLKITTGRKNPDYQKEFLINPDPKKDQARQNILDNLMEAKSPADMVGVFIDAMADKIAVACLEHITVDEHNGKVIIYTPFIKDGIISRLQKALNDQGFAANNVAVFSGEEKDLERFQNNPDCKVLIMTGVGSQGLNLQNIANKIILAGIPFTPAELEQLIARIYRPESNYDEVEVVIPTWLLQGDNGEIMERSYNDLVYEAVDAKREAVEATINGKALPEGFGPSPESMMKIIQTHIANSSMDDITQAVLELENVAPEEGSELVSDELSEQLNSRQRRITFRERYPNYVRLARMYNSMSDEQLQEFFATEEGKEAFHLYHQDRVKMRESLGSSGDNLDILANTIMMHPSIFANGPIIDAGCGTPTRSAMGLLDQPATPEMQKTGQTLRQWLEGRGVSSVDALGIDYVPSDDKSIRAGSYTDLGAAGIEGGSTGLMIFNMSLSRNPAENKIAFEEAQRVLQDKKGQVLIITHPNVHPEPAREIIKNTLAKLGFQRVSMEQPEGSKHIVIRALNLNKELATDETVVPDNTEQKNPEENPEIDPDESGGTAIQPNPNNPVKPNPNTGEEASLNPDDQPSPDKATEIQENVSANDNKLESRSFLVNDKEQEKVNDKKELPNNEELKVQANQPEIKQEETPSISSISNGLFAGLAAGCPGEEPTGKKEAAIDPNQPEPNKATEIQENLNDNIKEGLPNEELKVQTDQQPEIEPEKTPSNSSISNGLFAKLAESCQGEQEAAIDPNQPEPNKTTTEVQDKVTDNTKEKLPNEELKVQTDQQPEIEPEKTPSNSFISNGLFAKLAEDGLSSNNPISAPINLPESSSDTFYYDKPIPIPQHQVVKIAPKNAQEEPKGLPLLQKQQPQVQEEGVFI